MLVKNYSSGFLLSNIDSVVTTVTVNAGHSLPTTVGGVFTAIIWNSTAYASPAQDPNAEIVWGQYFTPNIYTITRGMEGTAPVAHSAGALIGLYITAGVLVLPYVKVSETQPLGTHGGVATTGSWQTRILNTKDNDTNNIAALSSNQLTLPAGTYKVRIRSPFYRVGDVQLRLQNITSSSTLILGSTTESGLSAVVDSWVQGIIILTVSSILAVQYQCNVTVGATDLGPAASFDTEVYTVAEFEMINTQG